MEEGTIYLSITHRANVGSWPRICRVGRD